MMLTALLFWLALAVTPQAWGLSPPMSWLPAQTVRQADGGLLHLQPWATARDQGYETATGYTLLFDGARREWVYAVPGRDGELAPSPWVVNRDKEGESLPRHLRPNPVSSPSAAHRVWAVVGSVTPRNPSALASAQETQGSISGRVTGPDGTTGLEGVYVTAYQFSAGYWGSPVSTYTDSSGAYRVGGLPGGTYRVQFYAPQGDHVTQWYDDATSLDTATDIPVVLGQETAGIDAQLVLGGAISGQVTGPGGTTGLESIQVYVYQFSAGNWQFFGYDYTDSMGAYRVGRLPSGTYRVEFSDYQGGHFTQWYDGAASRDTATDIPVLLGQEMTGIDARLILGGAISGRVTGPGGTTGLQSIFVDVYQFSAGNWQSAGFAYTDSTGAYRVNRLPGGTYRVRFSDYQGDHLTQWYDGAASRDTATDIPVFLGQETAGIDAQLVLGGAISGRVTGPDGTTGLESVSVDVYQFSAGNWQSVGYASTDSSGAYRIGRLPGGTYRVGFSDYQGGHAAQWYDGAASLDTATDIPVVLGQEMPGIDARLVLGGAISGRVTGPDGNIGLESVAVSVYQLSAGNWQYSGYVYTDSTGAYRVGGLAGGTYRVEFSDSQGNHLPQWYDGAASRDTATDIPVVLGQETAGIDAHLVLGGAISGRVTGPDGTTGLESVSVNVYQFSAGNSWYVYTDSSGTYRVGGLPGGTYRVGFSDNQGNHLSQWYDGATSSDTATDIPVVLGQETAGIDAQLVLGGAISGRVTGPDGTTGLESVSVVAYQFIAGNWQYSRNAYTDSTGAYRIGGLPGGTYRVQFDDSQGNHLTQWYDGAASRDTATDIPVVLGQETAGIDAQLVLGGAISGRVTGPDGTIGLESVSVSVYQFSEDNWPYAGSAYTDSTGAYRVGGLPGGTYRVRFSDYQGNHLTQWYDGADSRDTATDIPVVLGQETAGIDAQLVLGGAFSGRVTGADGTTGLESVSVVAYQFSAGNWQYAGYAYTDSTGAYRVNRLPGATYRVQFSDYHGNYVAQWFSDAASVDTATDVPISPGQETPEIDAQLASDGGGIISGRVTGPNGTTGLESISVDVYQFIAGAWDWYGYAITDSTGHYRLGGLLGGTYRVGFYAYLGTYKSQWYSNSSSLETATDIIVVLGQETSGIDARLALDCTTPDLVLANDYIDASRTHWACGTITAGPALTVEPTGQLNLYAGASIILRPGFQVAAGGRFRAIIYPGLAPDASDAEVTVDQPVPELDTNRPSATFRDVPILATPRVPTTNDPLGRGYSAQPLRWSDLPAALRARLSDLNARIRDAQRSADDAVIVFATETALAWPDTNDHSDIYEYAVPTATLRLVTLTPAGQAAGGPSHSPRLDGAGQDLLFVSTARDLVAEPGNAYSQIYHHDLETLATARLTTTPQGSPGGGASDQPLLAGDWAIYRTAAPDLAPAGPGLYRQHLRDGQRQAVGLDEGGRPDPRASHPAADGVGAAIAYQRPDVEALPQIYLNEWGLVEQLSLYQDSALGLLEHGCAALSPDGRYLAYREQGVHGATLWLHILDRDIGDFARQPWPRDPALREQAPRFSDDGAELWWLAPEQGPELPEVWEWRANPLWEVEAE